MEKKQEDLLRRPLYLYELPEQVLNTLTAKGDSDSLEQDVSEKQEDPLKDRSQSPSPSPSLASENVVGSQACSLCSLTFSTVQEQKGHLKSDLHHYNLKQKLRGLKPVSEMEFEKLIGDLDESLSGSDSDESDGDEDEAQRKETSLTALLRKQVESSGQSADDDENALGKKRGKATPPLLWLTSTVLPEDNYFGVYKALFTSEELEKEEGIIDAIRKRQLPPLSIPKTAKDGSIAPAAYKGPHIFLCMMGGGHFAAMVVALAPRHSKHAPGPMSREATVLAHKTFHRYTTRRKQGGSQSANDNAKGAAHSAGANLRRYNEQALREDVRSLLHEWKGLLDTSDLLFIRATGNTNRRTMFGPYEGQVLRANDPRTRGFPFSTRRATQNELMRSFIELTRLKVREIKPVSPNAATETQSKSAEHKQPKPATPKLSEEEETAIHHTSQIQTLIRRSKVPALLSYLKTNDLPTEFRFHPPGAQQNHHAPTPLHLAAAWDSAAVAAALLTRGSADPTAANADGKTAFELAGDRATRDAFRVARAELGEEAWDWEAAKVPPALTRAEADEREERERRESERKEAERRKAEEERLRKEGPKVADRTRVRPGGGVLGGGVPKTAQEKREEEARGLTPEQRMKLDRERRARAAEERIRRAQASAGG